MPLFTILDSETKAVITDALDSLLANTSAGGLGQTCLLVYPPKLTPCENCVYDPVTNRSSNRPRSGAPVPFLPGASCPMCGGRGKNEEEVSEPITLKCDWDPKKFDRPLSVLDVKVPHAVVQTKGYLADMPKLLKASHLIVNLPIAPYVRQKFVLDGQPGSPGNIIQARYCVAVWKQAD